MRPTRSGTAYHVVAGDGCEPFTAAREALEAIDEFNPEVVLLDIGMPFMDGYEVARRIQGAARQRRPRLIALTGWGQEGDQDGARAAGFDHHLVKPPDVERLGEWLTMSGAGSGEPRRAAPGVDDHE